MKGSVLFVSPSPDDAQALQEMLSAIGIDCTHVRDLQQAFKALEAKSFSAVLTEARLPDGTWEDVMRAAARLRQKVAVVVTDTLADARFWAEVLDRGVYDLIPKPFCRGEVQRILANAVDRPPLLSSSISAA